MVKALFISNSWTPSFVSDSETLPIIKYTETSVSKVSPIFPNDCLAVDWSSNQFSKITTIFGFLTKDLDLHVFQLLSEGVVLFLNHSCLGLEVFYFLLELLILSIVNVRGHLQLTDVGFLSVSTVLSGDSVSDHLHHFLLLFITLSGCVRGWMLHFLQFGEVLLYDFSLLALLDSLGTASFLLKNWRQDWDCLDYKYLKLSCTLLGFDGSVLHAQSSA